MINHSTTHIKKWLGKKYNKKINLIFTPKSNTNVYVQLQFLCMIFSLLHPNYFVKYKAFSCAHSIGPIGCFSVFFDNIFYSIVENNNNKPIRHQLNWNRSLQLFSMVKVWNCLLLFQSGYMYAHKIFDNIIGFESVCAHWDRLALFFA